MMELGITFYPGGQQLSMEVPNSGPVGWWKEQAGKQLEADLLASTPVPIVNFGSLGRQVSTGCTFDPQEDVRFHIEKVNTSWKAYTS